MKRIVLMPMLLCILAFSVVSCTDDSARPMGSPQVSQSLPDDKMFVGVGIGDDFSGARQNAFAEVVKQGIVYIIGESGYKSKQSQIESNFLPYKNSRYYILGEVKATSSEKKKKWLSTTSANANGKMEMKLQAYIDIKKLKADLDGLGVNTTTTPKNTTTTTVVNNNNATTTTVTPTTTDTSDEDLSDVDISSLTFLVTYNLKDPVYVKDQMQAEYAKWGIGYINKELSAANITTFDADTMETLAEERNLLQEETSGSVGIGQLLANAIHAEMYAEVTPSVTYSGNRATAYLDVKVYVRTTGKLIDTFQLGGGEQASANLNGAIKLSIQLAAKKIMKKLIPTLKKYVKDGRVYFVRLSGVSSYKDASKFTTSVKNVSGVKSVDLKSGSKSDGVYDYYVKFEGNPTDLMDRLFEYLPNQPGFENFDLQEVRGNELIFTLE